jgi:gluconate 2-dehydrogenase gamma chain
MVSSPAHGACTGAKYRSGPWLDGTPEQGFQSRFTPQEIYRIAIREINTYCLATHEKPFEQLPAAKQDHLLEALEKDQLELPSLSSKLFFDLLWRNTEEGFFADPMYGGNRGKAGWTLLGFPGVPSGAYREHLDNSEPYNAGAGQHPRRPARRSTGRRGRLREARHVETRRREIT